ncbi:MAG: ribosome biogenesis GTPase Der [Marinomonas sp.]|jgi:GTP-binding protein|uniref:ribosome biogenesis GTPase Der n=1 Tax=unclassified Marinomonas TaxID=196814 RepID=UPI0005FA8F43|nr:MULTISPECIES: ribosome biogenesis GTPase Der [unclassified Marinomonas]KJZ13544.1 GTPase Der [Marinomonas sp. S3726]KZM44329.1 GTPase Der [Marinomonas sp. SBI22]KZM45487.1 GTPase Der [Marinomonas sp. SBI8L]
MIPVIALVGRPNVGKSTLFNQLTRSRDALVADYPGLTRDRKYGDGRIGEHEFIVIDTGGISGDEMGIDEKMARQSLLAIEEADTVLFLVDGRHGLNPADEMIANHLRRSNKPTFMVVNKTDGINEDVALADFYSIGLGDLHPIAASHGKGVHKLIDICMLPFAEQVQEAKGQIDIESKGTRIGVIGRPNVGKSTLVNRMLGEDRVVVYDMPGTTRDSVYIPYIRNEKDYTLIDTAGVRRRKHIKEAVEKFSIVKTLKAIQDANVVIVVIDGHEDLVEQDLHMIGYVLDAGRGLVIAVNKWDGLDQYSKERIKTEVERRLGFVPYAKVHYISALHGTAVGNLYDTIDETYESCYAKWSTNRLTRIMEDIVSEHQPPLVRGRRIKLRYAHQGGSNPPRIVIHGNQVDSLPGSYKKYLENKFRQVLNITGTPISFEFKSSENPYAPKKHWRTGSGNG